MATPDQLLDFNQAPETGHLHHPVPGRSGFPPVSSFHRQQFASTTGGSNIDDSNDVFYGMRNMPLSTASQSPGIDGLMERREVAVAAVGECRRAL